MALLMSWLLVLAAVKCYVPDVLAGADAVVLVVLSLLWMMIIRHGFPY